MGTQSESDFTVSGENFPNPLDSIEEILSFNNWTFSRTTPDELMVRVAGRAGTYNLFFLWREDMGALQFCCQYDLAVPDKNRDSAARAVLHVNAGLWVGHFDISAQTGIPGFRQTCLLRGSSRSDHAEHIEDMVDVSLVQCERYYPLFRFLSSAAAIDEQNLNLAVMETAGEA